MNDDIADEIHFLTRTLNRLAVDKQRIQEQEIKYRRRLNQLSPRRLPDETLIHIFETACAPSEDLQSTDPYLPILLGSVCSYWRQIVYSTPTLWKTIVLQLEDPYLASRNIFELLRTYLQHGEPVPLTLKISFNQAKSAKRPELDEEDSVFVYDLFDLIFIERPGQLGTLILEDIPSQWWQQMCLAASLSTFPELERISFSWSERYDPDPKLPTGLFLDDTAPNLSHVSLKGVRLSIDLPWKQITSLEVTLLGIGQCIQLLLHCPNLREYHCRDASLPAIDDKPVNWNSVVFHDLQYFSWEFGLVPWDTALMMHGSFPSLRQLEWGEHKSKNSTQSPKIRRTSSSSSSESDHRLWRAQYVSRMQKLTILTCSLNSWTIAEFFAVLPGSLQELYLTGGNQYKEEDILLFFDTLNCHLHPGVLPNLKHLSIPVVFMRHMQSRAIIDAFVGMLLSRRPAPPEDREEELPRLEWIRLEIAAQDIVDDDAFSAWDEVQLAELEWHVQDGLRLELLEA